MTSMYDDQPHHEADPFEPSAEERAMAAQILGDGDPGHLLDLHPIETADEVERFVEWVESERMRFALDDNVRARAEERAADREAEEASAERWRGEEAPDGTRGPGAMPSGGAPSSRGSDDHDAESEVG